MPSIVAKEFQDFVGQLGLRSEVAAALWEADVHNPQELASLETAQLQKITDNPLLLKHVHPVLQKYLFNISMAKDPYKKAIAVMKKHMQTMEDDDEEEAMDTTGPATVADSTVSDASGFADPKTGQVNGCSSGPANGQENSARRDNSVGTRFNNAGTHLQSHGNGNSVQSRITLGNGNSGKKTSDFGHNITITGGNFVQANVLGQGPVTYNNTNTTITTSLDQKFDEDVKQRRTRHLNTHFMIDGARLRTADISWTDTPDFWLDRMSVPSSDYEEYASHLANDDIYDVRNPGASRALILNNIEFRPGSRMDKRTGADVDCKRLEETLKGLGFQVSRHNNKTGDEMKELLQTFAKSRENIKADMTVVYIGSHGERDQQGKDSFVGVDGTRVKFDEVRDLFSPSNSPLLVNKPKMFFLQFCRQESKRSSSSRSQPAVSAAPFQTASVGHDGPVSADAGAFGPSEKQQQSEAPAETRMMDILCVYATLAGTKAYRDTMDGSWFVTALIRILTENAHKMDVLSMLTKVNNSVAVNEGQEGRRRAVQVSEVVHNLRRKVFFYPGQNI